MTQTEPMEIEQLYAALAEHGVVVLISCRLDELQWPGEIASDEINANLALLRTHIARTALQKHAEDTAWQFLRRQYLQQHPSDAQCHEEASDAGRNQPSIEDRARRVCAEIVARSSAFAAGGIGRLTIRDFRAAVCRAILDDAHYRAAEAKLFRQTSDPETFTEATDAV